MKAEQVCWFGGDFAF